MSKKKNRLHGHYCKICGEYKANEKFSGKGHAAHICKSCSRLSAAEKAAAMDINRLMNLSMRRLSDSERKWLEAKVHDKRPEVAEMARDVYRACFPHAERNAMKKQLIINTLSFEVHTEVYDGYGDMESVDRQLKLDRKSCILSMKDFHADGVEQSITLESKQMAKLLRYIVHTLEVFMWGRDYSLTTDKDIFSDDFFAGETFDEFGLDEREEVQEKEPEVDPSWRVRVEYANHMAQDMSSYDDYLPERPEELYFCLLEYFEVEEEL